MMNSSKNQQKRDFVLTLVGPDHSGLQKVENPDEDKQTELDGTRNSVVKMVVIKVEECNEDGEVLNEGDNHANNFFASLEDCVDSIKLEAKPLDDRLCKARRKEPEAVKSEQVDKKMNLLKYESVTFGCTRCCKDFPSEQEYNEHMCMKLSAEDAVNECEPTDLQLEMPFSKRRRICRPRPSGSGSRPAPPAPADADTGEGEGTSRGAANVVNYGSEPESWESDDEELAVVPGTSRAIGASDTPEDEVICDPCTNSATASTAGTHSIGPSFYDFQWKQFPDSQIPPELRRETFSNIDVGPTTPCVDPYDTFVAIWDRQLMEHIASETNRYAQQVAYQSLKSNSFCPGSRISAWRDTTADELYVYFAIVMSMGIVVKSRVQDYWCGTPDIFYTPGFSVHMSLRRFQLLSKCLHFNNNEKLCALKLDVSEAKLFKIEPVVSHLNCRFQSLYNLRQNIAIEESLLQWKGWLDINQPVMPKKASTVGIRTYELCEPHTGYLWRFVVHAHNKSHNQASSGQIDATATAIVLRLIHGLEHKGHTLWMNDYYNSPLLARKLKTMGFDCVGTLRTNRQFVPETLTELTKAQMRPGQLAGSTSGDVDIVVWRDKNRLATISTYHGNTIAPAGESSKPTVISDYNIMMGWLHKKDKMLAMYPIERKTTKVWYKNLFRQLLNVSVLNAFILYKQSTSSPLCHRSFRITLAKSIFQNHSHSASTQLPLHLSPAADFRKHHLLPYSLNNGSKKVRIRHLCCLCKKRVSIYCVGCNKAVCMQPCFVSLHCSNV